MPDLKLPKNLNPIIETPSIDLKNRYESPKVDDKTYSTVLKLILSGAKRLATKDGPQSYDSAGRPVSGLLFDKNEQLGSEYTANQDKIRALLSLLAPSLRVKMDENNLGLNVGNDKATINYNF